MTALMLFVCFSHRWPLVAQQPARSRIACAFGASARRSVGRCIAVKISRNIVRACASGSHRAHDPGSQRTLSRPTKNPPKRVFPRPSRLPVGCLRGDGRSSLILVNSCSPLDGSNNTEEGPVRKWPNPSTACKSFAIPRRCQPAPLDERAGWLWITPLGLYACSSTSLNSPSTYNTSRPTHARSTCGSTAEGLRSSRSKVEPCERRPPMRAITARAFW